MHICTRGLLSNILQHMKISFDSDSFLEWLKVQRFFCTFHLRTYNTYYLSTLLTKYYLLYPTTNTVPFGAKNYVYLILT